MSLEIGKRGAPVIALQRTSSVSRTDGENPAPTSPSPQTTQANSQRTDIAAASLGDIWNGIANFLKGTFQAVTRFIGKLFSPAQPQQLDEESAAIAQAYNLLPTKENVQAFLAEAQRYEKEGAIGPGAPADSVKNLQEALRKLGYNLQASGEFDNATCAAVMDFKRCNDIHQSYRMVGGAYAVNEYADKATLAMIQQQSTTSTVPPATTTPTVPTTAPAAPTSTPQPLLSGDEAIIKQYNLLPTKENVNAFLAETQAYKSNGTLGPGIEAPADIKEMQTILERCGYPVKLNGIYDEATAAAITKFKQDAGIHENYKLADGTFAVNQYAGPDTLAKLLERAEAEAQKNNTTPVPEQTAPAPEGSGPLLKQGSQGDPVSKLQARLKELGCDPGGIDGIMGPKTVAAVKQFQASKGLEVDGIVGPQTWKQLGIQVEVPVSNQPPASTSASEGSGPLLKSDSRGSAVSQLQTRLKELGCDPGEIDGIMGPKTVAAVKQFQASKGLEADGIVGPQTWKQLGIHVEVPTYSGGPLESVSPDALADLGANNKQAFFDVLRPAAEEAERVYGVPAALTLAQAALESGWGEYAIGGYNIFGIKGEGPAGTVAKETQEWDGSEYITITDNFAKYNNFYEAVVEHGKLFHNGYYDTAVNQFAQDHSYVGFVNNIQGIYATSPTYSESIFSLIDQYGLA